MFPTSNSNKKPVKIGLNQNKNTDMGAFIENELKLYQSMKRRNHNPTALNSKNLNLNINLSESKNKPMVSNNPPIVVNNNYSESQNNLKNTMSNKGFNPAFIKM